MILLTDSISQSSNFCVIVLDETTYYISAFAVDSNGTIIDVQGMSITTSFEWKPDANTVMHFPFKNDILDKVWNATIPISWTKQSVWYQFSSSGQVDFTNSPTNCRFISVWLKYISSQWDYNQITSTFIWEVLYNFNHKSTDFYHRFQYHSNASSSSPSTTVYPTSSQQNTNSNQWYHMAYWTDWTKVYAYLNSVKVRETTIVNWLHTNTSMKLFQQMNIVFWELIWEKAMRSQTDITNYFNKTKWKYWLS